MWHLLAQSTEAVKAVAEVMRDAQQEVNLPWYERIIEKYGFTGAFTILVCFVTWRVSIAVRGVISTYGPKLIDAGVEHLRTVNNGLQAIVTAVDQSNETQSKHGEKLHSTMGHTNESLVWFARAAKEASEQLPDETRKRVVPHLEAIERLLNK